MKSLIQSVQTWVKKMSNTNPDTINVDIGDHPLNSLIYPYDSSVAVSSISSGWPKEGTKVGTPAHLVRITITGKPDQDGKAEVYEISLQDFVDALPPAMAKEIFRRATLKKAIEHLDPIENNTQHSIENHIGE